MQGILRKIAVVLRADHEGFVERCEPVDEAGRIAGRQRIRDRGPCDVDGLDAFADDDDEIVFGESRYWPYKFHEQRELTREVASDAAVELLDVFEAVERAVQLHDLQAAAIATVVLHGSAPPGAVISAMPRCHEVLLLR